MWIWSGRKIPRWLSCFDLTRLTTGAYRKGTRPEKLLELIIERLEHLISELIKSRDRFAQSCHTHFLMDSANRGLGVLANLIGSWRNSPAIGSNSARSNSLQALRVCGTVYFLDVPSRELFAIHTRCDRAKGCMSWSASSVLIMILEEPKGRTVTLICNVGVAELDERDTFQECDCRFAVAIDRRMSNANCYCDGIRVHLL